MGHVARCGTPKFPGAMTLGWLTVSLVPPVNMTWWNTPHCLLLGPQAPHSAHILGCPPWVDAFIHPQMRDLSHHEGR